MPAVVVSQVAIVGGILEDTTGGGGGGGSFRNWVRRMVLRLDGRMDTR